MQGGKVLAEVEGDDRERGEREGGREGGFFGAGRGGRARDVDRLDAAGAGLTDRRGGRWGWSHLSVASPAALSLVPHPRTHFIDDVELILDQFGQLGGHGAELVRTDDAGGAAERG